MRRSRSGDRSYKLRWCVWERSKDSRFTQVRLLIASSVLAAIRAARIAVADALRVV